MRIGSVVVMPGEMTRLREERRTCVSLDGRRRFTSIQPLTRGGIGGGDTDGDLLGESVQGRCW